MGARILTDYFGSLEKGAFVNDASIQFQELVAQCIATGKRGTFTITLDVTPNAGVDSDTVQIAGKMKAKAPELPRAETLFFVDDDYNLQRRYPRQHEMDVRVVTATDQRTGETGL